MPILLLALLFSLLSCLPARACSVPVFRYALERWSPAPYELFLFHKEPLTAAQQTLVKRINEQEGSTNLPVNVALRTVDLAAGAPPDDLSELWEKHKSEGVPLLVLRYPRNSAAQGVVWSGPYSDQAAERILNSPARRRVAQRILQGESAVWLVLESGDKSRDAAAAAQLQTRLTQMQNTLKLPDQEPDDAPPGQSVSNNLRLAFSMIRLSRGDPEEGVFVRMLLGSEEDLQPSKEPIVFPIFGRGRALFALVGKGINDDTIEEGCSFVVGACSCVVKEMNPGIDLLMAADWDSALADAPPRVLPELTGMESFQTNPAPPAAVSNRPIIHVTVLTNASAGQPVRAVPLKFTVLSLGALAAALFFGGLALLLKRRD